MFSSSGRPPFKSKTAKPLELPRYPVTQEAVSKPKKKEVRGMIFAPETNERLNSLYRKFIRSNRDNNSSGLEEQRVDSMLLQADRNHPASNVQHLRTNNSADHPPANYRDESHELLSEYLQKDPDETPKAYRESIRLEREESVRASESSACIELQVDRIKTRLQRLLFEQVGVAEERMCSRMKDINEYAVKLEVRLARFITTISALCNSVDQMRFRTSENVVLRELNKELQLKIKSLQQERRALKEERELEAMKDTVNRMKQVNLTRQQRAATPGKDRVSETEKKLLIKENIDLKRQRDALERQFLELKEEQAKLVADCEEMSAYCRQLEQGSDRSLETDKQQMYHKVVEHAEELEKKYEVLQFEADRRQNLIQELTASVEASKPAMQKKNEQISQLRLALKRSQQNYSELDKLKASIAEQTAEAEALNAQLLEAKKKHIGLQRQLEKKETAEKVRARELDELKEQIEKLIAERTDADKTRRMNELAEASKTKDSSREEEKKARKEVQSLRSELSNSKQQIIILQEENRSLKLKVEKLESQAELLRRKSSEVERDIKKSKEVLVQQPPATNHALMNALNQLIEGASPHLKDIPQELAKLLTTLYQLMNSTAAKLAESELELKKLNMYKNKLDHILHEDDRVQYNDFETSQVDAYFFRQKPKTDASLNEEMKRLAAKLDVELEQNIKNKAELLKLRKSLEEQQTNRKLARDGLLGVMDESLDRRQRQGQLTILLSVLELLEEKERLRRRLLGR